MSGGQQVEQAEVVARGGEDEVGGIAFRAAQEVAAEMAVALHVASDRLDGAAAAPLAADGRRDAALLARDEHAGLVGVIAAVDTGALNLDAGDALSLGDLLGQGRCAST